MPKVITDLTEDEQQIVTRVGKRDSYGAVRVRNRDLSLSRLAGRNSEKVIFSTNSDTRDESHRYYRCMGGDEFQILADTGRLHSSGFGGITHDRDYAEAYMYGPKGSDATHCVEFLTRATDNIDKELEAIKPSISKAEDGAMSFGLGPGQSSGQGGDLFNSLLKNKEMLWSLVTWKTDVGKEALL
jgi:hypothetical protein